MVLRLRCLADGRKASRPSAEVPEGEPLLTTKENENADQRQCRSRSTEHVLIADVRVQDTQEFVLGQAGFLSSCEADEDRVPTHKPSLRGDSGQVKAGSSARLCISRWRCSRFVIRSRW